MDKLDRGQNYDFFLYKYTSDGQVEWTKNIDNEWGKNNFAYDIAKSKW